MEKPKSERTEVAGERMGEQSGTSKNSRGLLILGEHFEFRENGSLKVDFDEKVIEFDPSSRNHLRRLEQVLKRKLLDELEPAVTYYSKKLGVKFKRITIRKSRTRWGSCSSYGNLNFNLQLVYLPPDLIRYVACHEVAHLKENHHGKAFWEILKNEFKNYREIKKRLRVLVLVRKTNFFLDLGKASHLPK